jgi:hypothetical protein
MTSGLQEYGNHLDVGGGGAALIEHGTANLSVLRLDGLGKAPGSCEQKTNADDRMSHGVESSRLVAPGGSPPMRNVWSAAALQAKCESDMLVCANVSGLCWSRSPGLNGMRCALVLFSFAAFEGCFRIKVSRAPGSTVVPSHASPANLAGMSKRHMIQPSSLACRCGNRGCDFQAWRFCQAPCAGQAFQAAAVCGASGGR